MKTQENNINSIKRLYRSSEDKKILGICAGIAEYFEVDPTLIRILWLLLIIFGSGIFLIVYILLYFIIPAKENTNRILPFDLRPYKNKRLKRSLNERVFAGICGGIANYLMVDPAIVRIIAVILDILTGIIPLFIIYLLLIWIVPLDANEVIEPSPKGNSPLSP